MKTMILILVLITNVLHGQSKQDSVQLKSGARATKARLVDKDGSRYETIYLNQSDMKLFVIAYDEKKKRYFRKYLPKTIALK